MWVGDLDGDKKLDLYPEGDGYEKCGFYSRLLLSRRMKRRIVKHVHRYDRPVGRSAKPQIAEMMIDVFVLRFPPLFAGEGAEEAVDGSFGGGFAKVVEVGDQL